VSHWQSFVNPTHASILGKPYFLLHFTFFLSLFVVVLWIVKCAWLIDTLIYFPNRLLPYCSFRSTCVRLYRERYCPRRERVGKWLQCPGFVFFINFVIAFISRCSCVSLQPWFILYLTLFFSMLYIYLHSLDSLPSRSAPGRHYRSGLFDSFCWHERPHRHRRRQGITFLLFVVIGVWIFTWRDTSVLVTIEFRSFFNPIYFCIFICQIPSSSFCSNFVRSSIPSVSFLSSSNAWNRLRTCKQSMPPALARLNLSLHTPFWWCMGGRRFWKGKNSVRKGV